MSDQLDSGFSTESAEDGESPSRGPDAEAEDADRLSPEEQMALYEDSLKESDWGHQPC